MNALVEEHDASIAPPNATPITIRIRMPSPRTETATAPLVGRRPTPSPIDYVTPTGVYDVFAEVCVASKAPSQKNMSRPSTKVEKCELARLVAHQPIRTAAATWR